MPAIAKDNFLVKVNAKGKELGALCTEVSVSENVINLTSGDTTVKLNIHRSSSVDTYLLERKNFDKKHLFEFLNAKNVKIPDNEEIIDDVYDYVASSDSDASDVYEHNKLGFVTINDELCFLAHHPIGLSDPEKATSTYHDPLVTEPVGTMDAWLDFVKTEIIGHPKLELALALAALGPVTYLLRKQLTIPTNLIVNIAGSSSTGKTTFLRICASVFGNPDEANGLLSDLHATENAFSARMALCHGLTVCCDESTLQPDWDFTKLLYAMSKGVDKLRCNQDGSLKNPNKFFSPVIITGETKLLDHTQKNGGLFARTITISQALTDNAEHADRITSACTANYGHAVIPLIECVLKHRSVLSVVYQAVCGRILDAQKNVTDGIQKRILKSFALILTAAIIARKAWGIRIDIKEMRKFLLSIFKEQLPESDPVMELYEKIMAGVAANDSKFLSERDSNKLVLSSNCWGKYALYGCNRYVYISTLGISTILGDDTALDKVTRDKLAELGLLKRFGDRYKKSIYLGKLKVACYCFQVHGRIDPPPLKKSMGKKNKISTSNINLLMSDDDDDEIGEQEEVKINDNLQVQAQ